MIRLGVVCYKLECSNLAAVIINSLYMTRRTASKVKCCLNEYGTRVACIEVYLARYPMVYGSSIRSPLNHRILLQELVATDGKPVIDQQ